MSDERPVRTEEERKAALEEALKRVRPVVLEKKNEQNETGSVLGRLEKLTNKPEEKQNNPKKDEKPMSMEDLAKSMNENAKKSKEAGLLHPERDAKDPLSKDGKDKEKSKEKDEKEKDPVAKQEQKMKEMFSKVKLPSGMEIHQEGPQWVLVSKDGKQRTDVTDVMNTIDKFNRDVDAANHENKMQNEAQGHVDKAADVNKKDEGLMVNETNGKVRMVGEALPNVKDVEGNQVFKPEDMEAVAKTALSASDEKAILSKLKDTKALEEMQERKRKNDDKADEATKKAINRELMQQRQNSK